ncbi:MAG: hypothetical protein QGG73_04520 [Candidatus Hydrogenedentes bacterium]|nr:hypothetical protein [Candidatus Hydrogenedentota bacterium]
MVEDAQDILELAADELRSNRVPLQRKMRVIDKQLAAALEKDIDIDERNSTFLGAV